MGNVACLLNLQHNMNKDGGVARIQYNEVFRTPSTVPYSDFKAW